MTLLFILVISSLLGASLASFSLSLVDHPIASLLRRSRCDQCQTVLKWRQLIPIFSSLILRNKCTCGHRPSVHYGFAELALALLFLMNTYIFGLTMTVILMNAFSFVGFYVGLVCLRRFLQT